MANTHVSDQCIHVALLEYIADQSIRFTVVEMFSCPGDNSSRILSTVLQNSEAIIEDRRNGVTELGDDANDTTHSETQSFVTWAGFRV